MLVIRKVFYSRFADFDTVKQQDILTIRYADANDFLSGGMATSKLKQFDISKYPGTVLSPQFIHDLEGFFNNAAEQSFWPFKKEL